jgi:hypothetical protein
MNGASSDNLVIDVVYAVDQGDELLMPNGNENYASYLLRFRCVRRDDRRTWIASIQSTATGEVSGFPNLDALVQFLRDEFGDCEIDSTFAQDRR